MSTASRWKRAARVIVKDREVDGLRIRFRVKKTLKPDPNSADIRIHNLGDATRATLQEAAVPVVLMAGYESDTQVIFSGTSRAVDHRREGQDWVTHIQCGDGEQAFRGFSQFSFGAGTKATVVLERIAKDLGIDVGDALAKLKRGDFREGFLQGYTATGRAVRELDRVAKALGLEWSIQDGQLQLLEPDAATQAEALVLSADSGLIGSPDHKMAENASVAPLLRAECLLNGGVLPGRLVKLETATRTGFYRVENVEHQGDTHGSEWTTAWEGRPR